MIADITTGGVRDRAIRDALYLTIRDGLDALGWFTQPADFQPINMVPAPPEPGQEVPLNTLAVTREDIPYDLVELGSERAEDRHVFYVDFFAESDAVGEHLRGDIRDILRGAHPAIGRDQPILQVFDRTLNPVPATPAFVCEIEEVHPDRGPRETTRAWEKHWYMLRCVVLDEH